MVDQRFGRLVVLKDVGNNRHSQSMWLCRCDCGGEKVVSINALRSDMTRSCGCLRKGKSLVRTRVEGTFRCTACKQRRPLETRLPESNYRCTECGYPAKEFNLPLRLWRRAKKRAESSGIPFSISPEDITIPTICPALGIPLQLQDRNSTPTLDRFIPELGYVPGNISVISWRANSLKKNGTIEEFEGLLAWMRSRKVNNDHTL